MITKRGFCILLAILFLHTLPLAAQEDQTQSSPPISRIEIGGHFSWLKRVDANTSFETFRRFGFPSPGDNPDSINDIGFGGRVTFNLTKNFSLEAELNFFPQDKRVDPIPGVPLTVIEPGGRKVQTLAGPKIGIRKKKYGVFGKVRPGIIWLDRYDAVIAVGTPKNFFVLSEPRKNVGFFNLDIGGVIEIYPSRRTVLRLDVGDTIINYRKLPPKDINPSIIRHNLQITAGLGFRF